MLNPDNAISGNTTSAPRAGIASSSIAPTTLKFASRSCQTMSVCSTTTSPTAEISAFFIIKKAGAEKLTLSRTRKERNRCVPPNLPQYVPFSICAIGNGPFECGPQNNRNATDAVQQSSPPIVEYSTPDITFSRCAATKYVNPAYAA